YFLASADRSVSRQDLRPYAPLIADCLPDHRMIHPVWHADKASLALPPDSRKAYQQTGCNHRYTDLASIPPRYRRYREGPRGLALSDPPGLFFHRCFQQTMQILSTDLANRQRNRLSHFLRARHIPILLP